jgi:hypothetical protein
MLRTLAALVPFLALAAVSSDAHAIGFDAHGTGVDSDPDNWDAPKVAPHTACKSLSLYAADVPVEANKTSRYRFTGECTINVARKGKRAVMREVDVLIDAEWSPLLKRASERVVIQDPDLGVSFSTWATCTADPFVANNIAFVTTGCKDKGMGANKFSAFISKEDAPFATARGFNQASAATSRVGANKAKLWENPSITRVKPVGIRTINDPVYFTVEVASGAGICPIEMDFGDGEKHRLLLWGSEGTPFAHQVKHTFAKPGAFKVTAKSLPGCTGEALVYAIIK